MDSSRGAECAASPDLGLDLAYFRGLANSARKLEPEAELGLVRRSLSGDLDALEHLVLSNLKLVFAIIDRYQSDRDVGTDDLFQAGVIGLLDAIRRFEPESGHRLSTYAVWWVRKRVFETLKRRRPPDLDSLDQLAEKAEEEGTNLPRALVAPDFADEVLEREYCRTILRLLPQRQRQVIELRNGLSPEHAKVPRKTFAQFAGDGVPRRALHFFVCSEITKRIRHRERHGEPIPVSCLVRPSQKQIGRVLGISERQVRNLEEAALVRLAAAA